VFYILLSNLHVFQVMIAQCKIHLASDVMFMQDFLLL